MITAQQLETSPGGIDCKFVVMGDAGMKCYTSKAHRDVYFLRQQWLSDKGYAPKCWFKFDFEGPDGYTIYAYYTEIVECADSSVDSAWSGKWHEASCELTDNLLEEYNIYWLDNHGYNSGYDGDKYVIVDVGRMEGPTIDRLNKEAGYPGWSE